MTGKPDAICGKCGFPLDSNESGVRHYGTFSAHPEHRCNELARAEITRLRTALEECTAWMEQMRECGDAGFWEWGENDAYTRARRALKGSTILD